MVSKSKIKREGTKERNIEKDKENERERGQIKKKL